MEIEFNQKKMQFLVGAGLVLAAIVLFAKYPIEIGPKKISQPSGVRETMALPQRVEVGVSLGDLGNQLVKAGVVDNDKFLTLYSGSKDLESEADRILSETMTSPLLITQDNSGLLLNFFWALGLANKNNVLETGPMMDKKFGNPGNFASTGGWTLAKGPVMDHYSSHSLVPLTPEQQKLVERVAKNIYRPCCNNSTYFPDCNHGMAMLGFLELMASQGASEGEMYKAALAINSYWFPDTYLTIAKYLNDKGINWNDITPQQLLGYGFSSASGYKNILSQTTPPAKNSGGSCGI